MTPPIDLAAVRKLADAATPGPWIKRDDVEEQIAADTHFKSCFILIGRDDPEWIKSMIVGIHWYDGPQLGCRAEDAAFIAEARTLVPAMAEEIETLRAKLSDRDARITTYRSALEAVELTMLHEKRTARTDALSIVRKAIAEPRRMELHEQANAEQPHRTAEEKAR